MNKKLFYAFILLMTLLLLCSCSSPAKEDQVQNGFIDLTQDSVEERIVPLDGYWDFYWNQLLDRGQFDAAEKELIKVPGGWTENSYPIEGYATYRLKANLVPGRPYGLEVKNAASAYNLYIDDRLMLSSGNAAEDKLDSWARLDSGIAVFKPERPEVDIMLQVSNYHYYHAGIMDSIRIGDPVYLQRLRSRQIVQYAIFLGIVLSMAVLHLTFFIFRKENFSNLYFSIAGFLMFIHISTEINKRYGFLFPGVSLQSEEKLQTILLMLLVPAAVSSLHRIFERKLPKYVLVFFDIAAFGAAATILITPFSSKNPVWPIYSLIILLGAAAVFYLLIENIRMKDTNALIVLAGVIFLIYTIVHDFLIDYEIIAAQKLFYLGWVLFLFSISITIARQFSANFQRVKVLSEELNQLNINLERSHKMIEERVRKRTDELSKAKLKLQQANKQLTEDKQLFKRLSTTDGLTQLANHSHITSLLKQEIRRADRYGLKLSIMMMDIDNFKSINDRFGHQVGDKVLRDTAAIIKENIRETDKAGRYGGEEFLIIMPETDADSAFMLGERIRDSINNNNWKTDKFIVTMSAGVAEYDGQSDILMKADCLMYEAKKKGKNRVEK